VQGDADIKGSVKGGGLVREVSPGRERFYTFGWAGGAILAVVAAVLVTLVVRPFSSTPAPYCVPGQITVAGSTAFAPAVTGVAHQFVSTCPSSVAVSVNPSGATVGSRGAAGFLQSNGAGSAALRATRLVMSDGVLPLSRYPNLVPHPIAIVIFGVVVNRATGITALTPAQLVKIWTGKYQYWSDGDLHGTHRRIDIVSRTTASGTRATFDNEILGGASEIGPSSANCTSLSPGSHLPVIRCEKKSTGQLLQAVNSIKGAIGYAEAAEAATARYPDIDVVQLGGQIPTGAAVSDGEYPFYAVEYMYTYGTPASGSLLSAFLSYMYTDAAENILQSPSWNDIPCSLTKLCPS
jgi:ABC-type phosphate transport system substrate-binding protein